MRRCAHEDSVTTGQRHKKETQTTARVTTCSKMHMSARVVYSFCLNTRLSAHRLGLRSQRFRHLASALSTQTLRECSFHLPSTTTSANNGLIPDHCVTKEQQLHWRVSEPSNTPTMLHESQHRSGTNIEKQGEICLPCPAKLSAQSGQKWKRPRCAVPAPTEGRVWSPHKTCTSKTGARQHKDMRQSVSSCSLPLCGRSTENSPTLLDDVSSN